MQIAVLSDFHLGAKDHLDRFGRDREAESRVLKLFDELERSVDRIVLLGDIFETLRGRQLGRRGMHHELSSALTAYPSIARRALDHKKYQLVLGNHDAILDETHRVPELFRIEADKMKLLFFHGHQLDPIARGEAPLSRFSVWLGGWLERIGLGITKVADKFEGKILRDGHGIDPGRFERGAVAMGEADGADVVITGHTHRAARAEISGTLYMNSGTCVGGRREMLLLDTGAKRFEVIETNEPT
ncbi:MAG: metallophosphoesterase family protein [Myxococcota bacterium]